MKLILLIICVVFYSVVCAQTKTEDAKDKLDQAKEKEQEETKKEEEKQNNTSIYNPKNLQEDKSMSFFDSLMFNIFLYPVTKPIDVLSYFILNTNLKWGRKEYTSLNVNYDTYPYRKFNGMRTTETSTNKFISEIQLFSGSNFENTIRAELLYRFHLYDNSIFFKYSYLYEKNAPYPINEIQFSYQRKARLSMGIDGGIFLGYKNFMFGSSSYKGFNYGAQFEFYPVKPISFQIAYDGTIYTNLILTNLNLQSRFHFDENAIAFTFNKSNVVDVHFNTFSIGFIKYF